MVKMILVIMTSSFDSQFCAPSLYYEFRSAAEVIINLTLLIEDILVLCCVVFAKLVLDASIVPRRVVKFKKVENKCHPRVML